MSPANMFKFATYSGIGNGRTRGRQVATLSKRETIKSHTQLNRLSAAVSIYTASLRRLQRSRGLCKNCRPHFFNENVYYKRQAFFKLRFCVEICE